jgi:putative addiction module component (TIGR02574 family)
MAVTTVMSEVVTWPIEERLRLVAEVWDSIEAGNESIVLSETHMEDLKRRLDAYRDDPKAGSSWEDVEARIRRDSEGLAKPGLTDLSNETAEC